MSDWTREDRKRVLAQSGVKGGGVIFGDDPTLHRLEAVLSGLCDMVLDRDDQIETARKLTADLEASHKEIVKQIDALLSDRDQMERRARTAEAQRDRVLALVGEGARRSDHVFVGDLLDALETGDA